MYLVVEFFPTKDLAVIPSNWIIQQGPERVDTEAIFQVYWPPVREPSKLNKLVKECANPTNLWKKYSARKLGSSENYLRAREKLDDATYTSNIDTNDDELAQTNRPRRKRTRVCISSSEDEELYANAHPSIAAPPQYLTNARPTIAAPPQYLTNARPTIAAPPQYLINAQPPAISTGNETVSSRASQYSDSFSGFADAQLVSSSPLHCSMQGEFSACQPNGTAFQQFVIKSLSEIKGVIEDLNRKNDTINVKLNALLSNSQQQGADGLIDIEEEFNFPLKTVWEVDQLEEKLQDKKFLHSTIEFLACIGGSTVKENVVQILRRIITNTCAKFFNWKGKGAKRPFSKLMLKNVICRAVQKNRFTIKSYSMIEVETRIKSWLKFASEREKKLPKENGTCVDCV